jgi:hypothetical protein
MDFNNLAVTISTLAADVPRMQKQIDELKLEMLKLHLLLSGDTQDQLELPAETPSMDPEQELRQQIEDVVSVRIRTWQYATEFEGVWRCPLVASSVAEMLGDCTKWREVKALIRKPGWDRLIWYYDPPPANWRGGDPNSKGIQWVAVRNV